MYTTHTISQTKSPEQLIWSLKHSRKALFEWILSGNRKFLYYFPSYKTLGKQADVTRRQAIRSAKSLKEDGLILILSQGYGKPNKYVINKKLFKGNFWTAIKKTLQALAGDNSKNVTLSNEDIDLNLQRVTNSSKVTTKEQRVSTSSYVTTMPESPGGTLAGSLQAYWSRRNEIFSKKGERNEL